jgi:hypothetical protein
MIRACSWSLVALLAPFLVSAPLRAQAAPPSSGTPASSGTPTSSGTPAASGAQAAQPAQSTPQLNFSGTIFGSYNYQLPTTPAQLPGQVNNAFVIDRAYLTFQMPAGDHVSIRITTDVYQSTEATPNAYTVRAKYAYLDYAGNKSSSGSQLLGRIGILQNVEIIYVETFWPRYLGQASTEHAGYFLSADVGAGGLYTLPNKMGEVYATIVNGPGYTTRERDRFKDYAIRFSFTPLANSKDLPLLRTLSLTAWGYKGALASSLVNAGVGAALDRSRAGLFVGIRDPRLVIGGELTRRHDEADFGATPLTRTTSSTTGHLVSGFTIARPFAFSNASGKSPFGIIARYDRVTPTAETTGIIPVPSSNVYHYFIGGVFYDLSSKALLALDYQENLNSSGGTFLTPPTSPTFLPLNQTKGYFLHFNVDF